MGINNPPTELELFPKLTDRRPPPPSAAAAAAAAAAMNCGICSKRKKLVCGMCTQHLILRSRINLHKSQQEVREFRARIAAALEGPRNGNLEEKLARTRSATAQCRARTALVREETAKQMVQLMATKSESRQRETAYTNELVRQRSALLDQITALERNYKLIYHQTLAAQSQCLGQMISIYSIRRRRRRYGQPPDTLLGFCLVPDANELLHHSPVSLNAGLERIASFTALCASYLGIQLPYTLALPTSENLSAAVFYSGSRRPLTIDRPLRELLRNDPAALYTFCHSLAMIILDVATLAARLGVPTLGLEDISKLNELLTQIILRIASQVHAGVEIQIQSSIPLPEIDQVQDHLITRAEVAAHAAWSVVDAPP